MSNVTAVNYAAFPLALVPLFSVVGNLLVTIAIIREGFLHSMTNYIIFSLSIADLLLAILVMPFGVYVEVVRGEWTLGSQLCNVYIFLDVVLSTASIYNILAISIDRFLAVHYPIYYSYQVHTGRSRRRTVATLCLVWLLSFLIACPILLDINRTPVDLCVFTNDDFILYSSFASFYLPAVCMISLNISIYWSRHKQLFRRKSNFYSKAPSYRSTSTVQKGVDIVTRLAVNLLNEEKLTRSYEQKAVRRCVSSIDGLAARHHRLGVTPPSLTVSEEPSTSIGAGSGTSSNSPNSPIEHSTVIRNTMFLFPPAPTLEVPDAEEEKTSVLTFTIPSSFRKLGLSNPPDATTLMHVIVNPAQTCVSISNQRMDSSRRRRDRRSTKTLLIVVGVFLSCWSPFFICHVANAICIKTGREGCIGFIAFMLTTWLGYFNSCINPIIYTVFNPDFRRAFRHLVDFCRIYAPH